MLATALYAYVPEQRRMASHLSLRAGDTVEVLRHDKSGAERLSGPWALGKLRGQTGWFPSSYVRRVPPAAERSVRTERLLEALARVLDASREEESAPLPGQLLDVERVSALLAMAQPGSGRDGEPPGAAAASWQSPLSRSLLGLPTAEVLLTASRLATGTEFDEAEAHG